jgi:transcriptional regulator with GAF, ATPase, and Fis domain
MPQCLRARLLCQQADDWLSRLDAALAAEDVAVVADGEPDQGGTTLLLLDATTPFALEAVAEVSQAGRARVLVAATDRRALADNGGWRLLRAGASDAFCWTDIDRPAAHVAARLARWSRVDEALEMPIVRRQLVGRSPRWLACLRQIIEIALFSDGSVLLLGESGTGKEMLARLVHTLDPRADKGELVVLDCTTVVPELAGSEFFGHERGAFTGAATSRDGAFALADRGSLFLDEVGELPLALQAQLLRVVQERTYKRVGSNDWKRTNFRLVCATHRDLRQDVAAGRFRGDFYHRIASRVCRIPALRERREDILPLTEHFLRELRGGGAACQLDPGVGRLLSEREYPGNVRELRQLVARISDRHLGTGPVTVGDVPEDERPVDLTVVEPVTPSFEDAVGRALERGIGLREIGRFATDAAIRLAIEGEQGNLQRAAKRLGVTDRALQLRRAQRPES